MPHDVMSGALLAAEAKEIKPILCIYHGNCADGFGAAWVIHEWATLTHIQVEFFAAVYQTGLPKDTDLEEREIYIVDFSYKLPQLLELAEKAKSIVILDHHKSAAEDLQNLVHPKINVHFDMEHSGAILTWNHFFPNDIPPPLLLHIEDRDLWRFALPNTREIHANVFSYPYDFAIWDQLMQAKIATHIISGVAIERKHHKDIAELVKACMCWGNIAGYVVPVVSLPYTLGSDAGHYMAETFAPDAFAACYYDTPNGRCFSLRSIDKGVDVSAVAKKFGGGGHARAAGFTVPNDTINIHPK